MKEKYDKINGNKVEFAHQVGDRVWDDLTNQHVTIIGITYNNGQKSVHDNKVACHTIGYWVNNDYCDGGRHPWEISALCPGFEKGK